MTKLTTKGMAVAVKVKGDTVQVCHGTPRLVKRVNSLQKQEEFLQGLKPTATTSSMSELRLTFPKNDPRPPQLANLIHLLTECNVKCEVLQFAVISSLPRDRIGAEEDQAVLAGTRNQSCRDGQMHFLLSLLRGGGNL